MSYQRERDEFMVRCNLSTETARALLRHATTLQRLAVAQCNGDWPADGTWASRCGRDTAECELCGRHWAKSSLQGGGAARLAWGEKGRSRHDKACPDCRTEARVYALLEGTQWQAWTQGDPRGYVLRLFPRTKTVIHLGAQYTEPVTRDDIDCERVSALGVPTR